MKVRPIGKALKAKDRGSRKQKPKVNVSEFDIILNRRLKSDGNG